MDATEKRILEQEKRIEETEKRILAEEGVIVQTLESPQFQQVVKSGRMMGELNRFRHSFASRISRHRFIFTLAVSTGIVLVWRGIWELTAITPFISESVIALIVGLVLLWALERYSDLP